VQQFFDFLYLLIGRNSVVFSRTIAKKFIWILNYPRCGIEEKSLKYRSITNALHGAKFTELTFACIACLFELIKASGDSSTWGPGGPGALAVLELRGFGFNPQFMAIQTLNFE